MNRTCPSRAWMHGVDNSDTTATSPRKPIHGLRFLYSPFRKKRKHWKTNTHTHTLYRSMGFEHLLPSQSRQTRRNQKSPNSRVPSSASTKGTRLLCNASGSVALPGPFLGNTSLCRKRGGPQGPLQTVRFKMSVPLDVTIFFVTYHSSHRDSGRRAAKSFIHARDLPCQSKRPSLTLSPLSL